MSGRKPIPVAFQRSWQSGDAGKGSDSPQDSFTLMTYNILNDSCISSDSYAYCDTSIRYMPHRYLHIKEEIRLYGPDIVCMQEINQDQHNTLIHPMMSDLGYDCVYGAREPHRDRHIDAIFYKNDTFCVQNWKAVTLYDEVVETLKNTDLDDLTLAAMRKHLMLSHQVVMAQLYHKPSNKDVYVANIHVYWGDLQVPDVQAVQACAAVRCLQAFTEGVARPCYILAGDFNTPPGWPAYQLITDMGKRNIKSNNVLKQIQISRDDGQAINLIDSIPEILDVTLKLKSSYKHVLGEEPSITSCDFDYSENKSRLYSIDYIWFGPDTLDVAAVLQTPSDEIITQEKALPSSLFPSDHLPLMAKFIFNEEM